MDVEARKAKAEKLRGRESRTVTMSGFEMRDSGDGTWNVEGCASVTERAYSMGWYDETIARGAFTDTLARNPDVQLLLNHDGLPLARTVGGSLRLWEGDEGLMFRAQVDQADPDAQRLNAKASRGLLDQCSFAFSGAKSEWDDDMTQRRITTLDIHRGDVSIVNQGANPATSFTMRSLFDRLEEPSDDEIEEFRSNMSPDTLTKIEMALTRIRGVPAEPQEELDAPAVAGPSLETYLARAFALRARA